MIVAPPSSDWLVDYTPFRSLPLDQEALRIYEHAYVIGLQTEPSAAPKISFSTLLIALLRGEDETSRWFAEKAPDFGPKPDLVYAGKELNATKVEGILRPASGKPDDIKLSANDRQLLTESARAVLENAEQWAHQVGGSDIGVRHLVASYVLNPPPNHRAQMSGWNYRELSWRRQFFTWVAERYTAEEWTDASSRPAPSRAVPTFEQQEIKGDSLDFRDRGDTVTQSVLDLAAEFNAYRGDQQLRLLTVFFALIEFAKDNPQLKTTIQPIWNAIETSNPQYEASRQAYFPEEKLKTGQGFSDLIISPQVLNALETARELTVSLAHDFEGEISIGALHLAGALISRRVDGDEEIASLGLTPQSLRLNLINHAQMQGESVEVWREALGEEESLQAGRPVDLNSDEPEAVVRLDEDWKSDPLSIRPDVEAFAALLASKSLEPPLSIGLFGPWGSGKTTFLRRLHRAVESRASDAKQAVKDGTQTPYVSNIVHVDFNAWHFAEDALTSSLVDTILRALSGYIKDDQIIAGTAWSKAKLAELETTKRKLQAAEAVKAAAQSAVTTAETALISARNNAARMTTSLQAVLQGVWTTTKCELLNSPEVRDSGVLEEVGDTIKSGEQLEARLNSIRSRPARLLHDLGWARSILFAALVLLLPPLVAWLVGNTRGLTVQVVSIMSTMLVLAGGWLRTATRAVAKVDRAINEVAAAYEQRVADDDGVKTAQQNLDAAHGVAITAEASVQAAREALAKAQAEAANASLPAQMLQLVSSRIEEQTYNRELTTLSLARADLQALSILLRDQRSATAATPAGPATPRAVDRVILYIDDLDRCKPTDVVRVLQLVHMLLAFELFVVVVAVDARWVEEALVNSYKWLANEDNNRASVDPPEAGEPPPPRVSSHVTPQDYLEKIFQISFWLEPMTSARAASYLGSLVRTQDRGKRAEAAAETDGKVDISSIELDYMRALAAYVGPSPRRVKRLVNAYRLIKARLSNTQLDTFVDRAVKSGASGPYQLVIGLLVIGTGAPATSAQILKELAECDPKDSYEQVIERFREREHPDWLMASKVIETLMRTQKASDVSELRGWARKVGRFLLKGPAAEVA